MTATAEANLLPAMGRSLSRTSQSPSALDSIVLFEPTKRLPVPNHLLDTKIYARISRNAFVQSQPGEIHFAGFTVHETSRQTISFTNVSAEVTRFHIIPPQTQYFTLHYTKQERLVPGFSIECVVEFRPDEVRYFYDAIRIHSKDEDNNLIIPIHAYPVIGALELPENITFTPIAVGQSETKVIALRSSSPADFEFRIDLLQQHPAFIVHPLSGVIPAMSETEVVIIFSPIDFVTARITLQFSLSQFNFQPRRCTVMGYSEPGLLRQQVKLAHGDKETFMDVAALDPQAILPLNRARINRATSQLATTTRKTKTHASVVTAAAEKVTEREGLRIPKDLNSPYAVAAVLNQKFGKLKIKELREVLDRAEHRVDASRQLKEALFDQEVRQDVYEERQNQLRWQVKLGAGPMSPADRHHVLVDRAAAWMHYQRKRGDLSPEEELSRQSVASLIHRRTQRSATEPAPGEGSNGPQFHEYLNNVWLERSAALIRFQQAAWKVMVRFRADRRLQGLRRYSEKVAAAKYAPVKENVNDIFTTKSDNTQDGSIPMATVSFTADQIAGIRFPTGEPHTASQVHDQGTIKIHTHAQKDMVSRPLFDYYPLQTAKQWMVDACDIVDVQEAARSFYPIVPPDGRKMRAGPEDEMIVIPLDSAPIFAPSAPATAEEEAQQQVQQRITNTNTAAVLLSAPPALMQPVSYPSLHIFNPSPGLQVHESPQLYSETDPDFHLCPLPRYLATGSQASGSHAGTQRRYLTRGEVIRGAGQWAKFPSPSLTALTGMPTLTSVWMPRWSSSSAQMDLLSAPLPIPVEGLSPDDAANIIPDDDPILANGTTATPRPVLMPEMIRAEFPIVVQLAGATGITNQDESVQLDGENQQVTSASSIPSGDTGFVPRWQRERELDDMLQRQSNQLGQRITQAELNLQRYSK